MGTLMMRRLLFLAWLLAAAPLSAQTVTVRATDPSTGADVQAVGDDTNDSLRVTIASPATMPVSGTITANQGGTWLTQGMVAHDAAYSGNPLPLGCYASAAAPTNVSADADMVRMWCLRNGALSVNLTNASIAVTGTFWQATQPVSGTVAATQSGTWTVQPGNTANTTAWLVTGTGGTFPATQSGTWNTRTQDGTGNAITSATRGSERALTVQVVDASGAQVTSFGGSSSNAAASATGSAVPASASYTGLGVSGTLRGWTGLSLGSQFAGTVAIVDGSGNQVTSFGGSGGTASNFTSAVPASGTAVGFSDGTNMQAARVFDADTGAGTQYVQGVSLRASGSGGSTEIGTAAAPVRTDPTGTTTQPVSGTVTVSQGTASSLNATVRAQDGSGNALTSAARGSERALSVQIVDAAGAQVATFGGGTQYTEDAAAATNPTGNMMLAVRSDTLSAQVDANGDNVALRATNNGELFVKQTDTVHIDDNAGSLTVDAPVGTPVFVRLSDGSSAIATLPVSLASLPALVAGTANVGLVGRQPTYGSKQTVAWTGTSLGSTSARQSDDVDWTTTRCADARIRIQSKGQASGTNFVDWYVYTALSDTTYTDGATGTDGTFTAANRFNSRYLGSLKMNAATSAVQAEFQLSDIFGSMPTAWGLIGINNSGAALSATAGDHVIEYQCVN